MVFYPVDYSLNSTYYVEDNAVMNVIESIGKTTTDLKITGSSVKFLPKTEGYTIQLSVDKKKSVSYKDSILKLTTNIEADLLLLLDSAPENINITVNEIL